MISKKEIEHIAKLARLGLTEQEIENMRKDLSSIFDYFKKLKKTNVSNIKPTSYSVSVENEMRDDKEKPFPLEKVKNLIDQIPRKEENHIKVKSIF